MFFLLCSLCCYVFVCFCPSFPGWLEGRRVEENAISSQLGKLGKKKHETKNNKNNYWLFWFLLFFMVFDQLEKQWKTIKTKITNGCCWFFKVLLVLFFQAFQAGWREVESGDGVLLYPPPLKLDWPSSPDRVAS